MKRIIWGLGFIIVLVAGVLVYMFTSDISVVIDQQGQEVATVDKEESKSEQEEKKIASTSTDENEELNPFDTSIKVEELDETHYENYIHGMSHQKVVADEKWGFYKITEDRIQWLLEGLEIAQLNNEEVYRDILDRWASGDFSIVDQDHNTIWRMQNGNVGKATGILSPEEEKAYIESQD